MLNKGLFFRFGFLVAFILSVFSNPVMACGKEPIKDFNVNFHSINNLQEVSHFTAQWIQAGVVPQQIVVILDVDGTLVDPADSKTSKSKYMLRDYALGMISDLSNQGVHIVISSAWNMFGETLVKLRETGISDQIGLGKTFDVNRGLDEIKDKVANKKIAIKYRSVHKIASVQDSAVDPIFFRQKALAPRFVLSKSDLKQITHVALVDNDDVDIGHCPQDLRRFDIYGESMKSVFLFKIGNFTGGLN